jgi:lipopolysaccharide/colanic/teichoic acid biosynthesis glycosyltransferase
VNLLETERRGRSQGRVGKRVLDLVALVLLVPFVVPLGLLIALAVWLDSAGGVFYRASRVGFRGEPIAMLKFRTMRVGVTGSALAVGGDARVTPLGHILRKSRLDELPQLWNVLRGEMSFVGPRPELAEFVDLHAEDYEEILAVAPGLTGPTQLRFAGVEAGLLSMHEDPDAFYREHLLPDKVALDVEYARSRSLRKDLTFLLLTLALPAVLWFQGSGDSRGAAGRNAGYVGLAMAAFIVPVLFTMGLGPAR